MYMHHRSNQPTYLSYVPILKQVKYDSMTMSKFNTISDYDIRLSIVIYHSYQIHLQGLFSKIWKYQMGLNTTHHTVPIQWKGEHRQEQ